MGNNKNLGFTIIETLIVLTVTGILAISAMALINGRQNKTEFQVAINDFQQQLQEIINETANGYYPNNADFDCIGNSPLVIGNGPLIKPGSHAQGSNDGCIFIGKALQFSSSASPSRDLRLYPLVGNQQVTAGGQEVTNLAEAKPTALAQGGATNLLAPAAPFGYTDFTAENGLTFHSARFQRITTLAPITHNTDTSVIAFVTTFGAYDPSTGNLKSSSQQLKLYAVEGIVGTPPSSSRQQIVDAINSHVFTEIDNAKICYASGGTNQSGLITIGGRGGLQVTLKIYGNRTCS